MAEFGVSQQRQPQCAINLRTNNTIGTNFVSSKQRGRPAGLLRFGGGAQRALHGGGARRAALAASRAAARERDLRADSERSAAKARSLRQSAGLTALLHQFHAEQQREQGWQGQGRSRGNEPRAGAGEGGGGSSSNVALDGVSVAKYAAAARERQRGGRTKAGGGAATPCCAARVTPNGEAHEQQWRQFCAAPPRRIGMDDIPWPHQPEASACSAAAALCATVGLQPPPAALLAAWDPGRDASLKGAMRTAMLRWHPDKFEQAFGTRLTQDTGERERILGRVRGIMQRLVEAKERWDALYRHPQYGCPKCNTL